MEMLDRLIYKFCGWIDNQFKKVEDVLTMDFTNFSKRKKKKKWKKKVGSSLKSNLLFVVTAKNVTNNY